jgi:hypothetical protein
MTSDDLEARLARLPPLAPDDATDEHVRRRAHAALAAEARLARLPSVVRAWFRFGEPLALASACAVYLALAVRAVDALYR